MKKYNFDEVVPRSDTDCVKYDLRKVYFGTEDVIPMWVADMDFCTPDFIINAIRERLQHEVLGYSIRPERFNKAIIDWMKLQHDWDIRKSWISFSPGVVPALNMLVLAFTKPGDKIIVQPPVYYPFFSAIQANGRIKVDNPLKLQNGRLCMDFEDLKNKAKEAKMILISHPQNPGGSVWREDELRKLAEICLENNVLMVSDEIHSDLIFAPNKHIPLASISKEIAQQTITCNAPSKTFNVAGLSTAYLITPNREHYRRYNHKLNEELHLSMGNIFGNIALVAAYENGKAWLGQLLDYVAENIRLVEDFCKKYLPMIIPIVPESTYMIWLDCRRMGLTGDDMKDFFIKKARVGFNDGRVFGEGGEGFMRMNVACQRATLLEALKRIKNAF
ncbi:MAG: putative C-S lyase [Candidatus Moranbacteria bacterium]|nr:putative C-S lyase [Candidatus Moranbacteria bacterium]